MRKVIGKSARAVDSIHFMQKHDKHRFVLGSHCRNERRALKRLVARQERHNENSSLRQALHAVLAEETAAMAAKSRQTQRRRVLGGSVSVRSHVGGLGQALVAAPKIVSLDEYRARNECESAAHHVLVTRKNGRHVVHEVLRYAA